MNQEIINFKQSSQITVLPVEDTELVLQLDLVGADKKSLIVELTKPNLACRVASSCKLAAGNQVNLEITMVHKAPNTSSNIVVRHVLQDGGISEFKGSILIKPSAQGSSASLEDRTLVVGNGTKNHTEPVMSVEANDVTASHASSTGRVDESLLYYLQSRGLTREESTEALIQAFLEV